jgi:hypothetical protein
MHTKRIMTVAAVLAAAAALPAARAEGDVNSGTETAVDGPVSATIGWDAGEGPRNMRLAITRNGVVGLDRTIPLTCGEQCSRYGTDTEDFGVRDLDGDGEREVVLRVGSDEPCCYALGIFDYRPADGTYREFSPVFASGVRLEDLNRDGRPELNSADSRITGGPVQIFDYVRTDAEAKLVDVTRKFPRPIREDAKFAKLQFATGKRPDVDSAQTYLSEYVADQYLLGRGAAGLKELDKQIKRGILGKPKPAANFKRALLQRLERFGYR